MLEALKRWLLVGPVLLYSVILHEISHGYIALLNGDPTALEAGRLTLNPIPHIDLWGSIVFPMIQIVLRSPFFLAWAKPVPYNPVLFTTEPHLASLEVAFAGPATNMVLALFFAALLRLTVLPLARVRWGRQPRQIMMYGIILNCMLALFNLLPIPPLDGFMLIRFFFPMVDRLPILNSFGTQMLLLVLVMALAQRFLLVPARRLSDGMVNWANTPLRPEAT